VAGNSATGAQGGAASKTFLLAAVGLGVLATVLAFLFIEGTAGQDRGPRTRIVVAKRDLRPNAAIDPDRDLEVDEIPTKYAALAAQSLNPEALANYRGQRINRRIQAKQPVLLADLAAVAELELKPGERALTIPADPGIIIPGDYVKIIVSRPETVVPNESGQGGTRVPGQVTIIGHGNGYRVVAVGSSLFKTRQQVTGADQYESTGSGPRTVTLAVTEDDAREIQGALGTGQAARPTLLLCPPGEAPATNAAGNTSP
jgi:Flp pilus assembly protein CpaB